jgi:hypothetical protein
MACHDSPAQESSILDRPSRASEAPSETSLQFDLYSRSERREYVLSARFALRLGGGLFAFLAAVFWYAVKR